MIADTERQQPTETESTAGAARGSLRRRLPLLVFAVVFAVGAASWVQFFRAPGINDGNRVRLFSQTDFPAYTLAARIVASGRGAQLYDLDVQYAEQQALLSEGYLRLSPGEASDLRYPYPYTPIAAVLWSPFAGLPPLQSLALWDVLNLAAFAGGLWYLLRILPLPQHVKLWVLLGGLTCFPFISNLEQGQSSGFVMLALAGGTALLKRERDLPAGLVFGLLLIKVQWLPFLLLVLLWKRRWRALAGFALACLALGAVVVLAAGTDWVPGYIEIVKQAQAYSPRLLLDPSFGHGLPGLLSDILGKGNAGAVSTLNSMAMLALAGFLLFAWRGSWKPGSPGWDGAMALTLFGAMLTNPQLNTHDLCLAALPAGLALSRAHAAPPGTSARSWVYALSWVLYLAPAAFFFLGLTGPVRVTALSLLGVFALLAWLQRPVRTAKPGSAQA